MKFLTAVVAAAATVGLATATAAPQNNNNNNKPMQKPTHFLKGGRNATDSNDDFCSIIDGYLPYFCSCASNDQGGDVSCSKDLFSDQITVQANVQPCANPADIVFGLQDSKFGVSYSHTFHLEDSGQYDIPGLTFGIPDVATASAVLDVTVQGNLDDLQVSLAVDACGDVAGITVCGSDLTSDLPLTLLTGTFDFSNLCN